MAGAWSITVTLHAWWLLAYLAVGVVLYVPLNMVALHRIFGRPKFADEMRRLIKRPWRFAWGCIVQIVMWPFAAWEAFS